MENIIYNFDYQEVFLGIKKIPALKNWTEAAISHTPTNLKTIIDDSRNRICFTSEDKFNFTS